MALKIKKKEGGGANWMDTYGDMVTLLLCFFVLLYSMSTIDAENWKIIVMSFNPNAIKEQTEIETGNDNGPSSDPGDDGEVVMGDITQADVEASLEEIMQTLQSYAQDNGLSDSMEVTKGDGYVFVSFNEAVFFPPDSYEVTADGKVVLDVMSSALETAAPYIDEVRVLGHTAQARADQPNNTWNDRSLSALRSAVAVCHFQDNTPSLDNARIVGEFMGQWRPIDSNETKETRAHNRRIEVLITGFDIEGQLGDSLEQYYTTRAGEAHMTTDAASGGSTAAAADGAAPPDTGGGAEDAE